LVPVAVTCPPRSAVMESVAGMAVVGPVDGRE
jgi:hypothetical protein